MKQSMNSETNRENAPKDSKSTGRTERGRANGSEEPSENGEQESNGLREMLVDEMADVYHAEKQLLKALPKMAKAAQSAALREALEEHLEETEEHVTRLEEAFAGLEEEVKSKKCKAMEGLLAEGEELMKEHEGEPTIDAALIAAGQKVEHYEIASYGTLQAWAQQLGEDEAAQLFGETLEEEKAADEKLTAIAEDAANTRAEAAE